ncbi:MAG TPA: sensor histidine kinase [Vicinamibacterales bacterium]|jgi:signal transduction histidine kinase|nr:sensor histidine kinase [Vicinamibacterales bacterium]
MGAALWTLGLFAVVTIVLTLSVRAMRATAVIHAHSPIAGILAFLCMIAGLALIRGGLAPFDDLRNRLSAVRKGMEGRLLGSYPSEVQPLIDDLNALLDHREQTIRRALAKAGDLAHGLKTPLAILAQEADRAESSGHLELATTMGQQVERMRRQIEWHLAHARAAASGATPGAKCSVSDAAQGLSRTLGHLYADRRIGIEVDVPASHCFRGQREDLDEMLGNLLDNACKWGRSRVTLSSTANGTHLTIRVEDDGSGIEMSKRSVVLQRGVRADEATPGSGFGLAIVRDLAELYGGAITLDSSSLGGVRAELRLPSC